MLRWKDKVLADVDGQKLFRNSGAYILLGLSVVAMTFFGICAPQGGMSMLPSGSAAKVAGEKISAAEFQRAYQNMSEQLQAQFQEDFEFRRREIPKYVMRQLVDNRIMYQAALKAGIEAQEDDVVRMLKEVRAFQDDQGKFSPESFQNYLRRQGYTEATFTDEIRRNLTVQLFRQFVSGMVYVSKRASALDYRIAETKIEADFLKLEPAMAKVTVSADDIKKFLDDSGKAKVKSYYDSHSGDYNTSEKIKARHILVSYKGARNASGAGALRSKAEAKTRAEDVLKQVKEAGADFAKIAAKMTDEDAGKSRGGDLGFFNKDDMVKEFSDASFALNVGQVSQVVESPFGFHVIKVEQKQPAKNTTFEQATDEIARKIIEQERAPSILQQKADTVLADLKAGKSIDDQLKALGAKWESTGPVAAGSISLPKVDGDQSMVDAVARLPKAGAVADRVFDVRGSKVILRLKSRQDVDEAKLDDKKKKELADSAASIAGYALMTAYEKSLRKELEQKGKIWENPEYLRIGQSRGDGPSEDVGG